MFSPEWEAERTQFYRGLFIEYGDESGDDHETKLGFSDIQSWQGDRHLLAAAVEGLKHRVWKASGLLEAQTEGPLGLSGDPDRHALSEVLSDCHLMLSYLVDALAEFGPDDAPAIHIRRRGGGRPADGVERVRKGFAAAKAVERLVATGVKQEAAISEVCEETGFSRSTLMDWLSRRRKMAAVPREWPKSEQR